MSFVFFPLRSQNDRSQSVDQFEFPELECLHEDTSLFSMWKSPSRPTFVPFDKFEKSFRRLVLVKNFILFFFDRKKEQILVIFVAVSWESKYLPKQFLFYSRNTVKEI